MQRQILFLTVTVILGGLSHKGLAMEPTTYATSMMALPDEGSPLEDMREQLHLNEFDESDLDMITHVGRCYFHGWGLQQDFEKAFQYFVFAAKQGYATAQYYLGCCCSEGKVVLNPYIAFDCFQRAARQGHTEAQSNLADCFFYGRGTKQDNDQARHWYLQAASQGDRHAQRMLAQYFAHDLCSRSYLPLTAPWSLIATVQENMTKPPAQQPTAPLAHDDGLADTVFAQAMEE